MKKVTKIPVAKPATASMQAALEIYMASLTVKPEKKESC